MSQCNMISPASYAVLFSGILFGAQKEYQEGSQINLLLASMGIILLLSVLSIYDSLCARGCGSIMPADYTAVLRAICSALFTTDLCVKYKLFGDTLDYLPVIIAGVLGLIYIMQGNYGCDRSFLPLYQFINTLGQFYVAIKTGQAYTAAAAFSLLMAYCMANDGDGFMNISPFILYNLAAGGYCLTANGKDLAFR